jgi:hypothetical protein
LEPLRNILREQLRDSDPLDNPPLDLFDFDDEIPF